MQAEEHADRPPLDTAWLDALLGGSPAGVAVFDGDLRYVYVNPALERINGVPAAAHLGRNIGEVLPDVDVRLDVMRRVLADGRPRDLTASGRTWADSAVERRYWRGACHRLQEGGRVSGLMVITQEITATQIEREELLRARSYLTLLDNAAVSIGTTLDAGTTCQELADFVVPVMADVAVVELIPEEDVRTRREPPPGALRLRRAGVATVPGLADSVARFGGPGTDIDYQEDAAVPRCLAADEPVIENLYGDEQLGRSAPTPERVGAYRAIGLHSAVAVPLTARGRPLGVLSLLRAGASPPFTEGLDVVVARTLAGRAAVDIDHAHRYTHEHRITGELQRSLLSEPRGPNPGIEIASLYLPAGAGALVGGDWFDAIPLRGGRHLKVMGDVMGHGVEAAVAMSNYRSMLRIMAEDDQPPHRILERLDKAVEQSGLDRAATCLVAVVDRREGVCEVASAGHPPPVFIDPGAPRARVAPLVAGPPLGTGFGGYRTTVVPCGPGTVLFMYTDGLVERRGEDIDLSIERLTRLTLPAGGRLQDLLDEVVDRFADTAEDDIAVLVSRSRGY
ncbi:SpoIIE family protein phosphatase [Streptomyces sp. NPDC049952]|uniref:SpoIIE family protein phosphatase n=1 Tax=unclassified Streptomyces TaxID=2593676 RepID=UPI000BD64888|nr:PAS domain S-box-containing protein [Streptomyces avidinii]SNX76778.1 PAS domain S-box-containing protein [Streptomyces microflavus]